MPRNYLAHIYWAASIKNSIVMICWTALAIYFGKWWIALFAVFCLSNVKYETNTGENQTENSAIDSPSESH